MTDWLPQENLRSSNRVSESKVDWFQSSSQRKKKRDTENLSLSEYQNKKDCECLGANRLLTNLDGSILQCAWSLLLRLLYVEDLHLHRQFFCLFKKVVFFWNIGYIWRKNICSGTLGEQQKLLANFFASFLWKISGYCFFQVSSQRSAYNAMRRPCGWKSSINEFFPAFYLRKCLHRRIYSKNEVFVSGKYCVWPSG